mmetsp:Transcript_15071/g.41136  ORF Transcript_15071/g.41136 Transcript_15071/m.41136 type:complete len:272 (-) Transcript_15071:1198-2013(-)
MSAASDCLGIFDKSGKSRGVSGGTSLSRSRPISRARSSLVHEPSTKDRYPADRLKNSPWPTVSCCPSGTSPSIPTMSSNPGAEYTSPPISSFAHCARDASVSASSVSREGRRRRPSRESSQSKFPSSGAGLKKSPDASPETPEESPEGSELTEESPVGAGSAEDAGGESPGADVGAEDDDAADARMSRPDFSAATSASSAEADPPVVPTLTGAFALAGLRPSSVRKSQSRVSAALSPGGAGVDLATATTARIAASTGAGASPPAAARDPSV